MVDNYDSFTYNLVHYLQQFDHEVIVKRNDCLSLAEVESLDPSHIVISPGPGTPNQAGLSLAIIETFKKTRPILGVCLGHQAIGQAFGGRVVNAKRVMHGKTSPIYHNNHGVFANLPQAFNATRYHSLVLDEESLPDCLEVTAWTEDALGQMSHVMGIKHREWPIEGVQFHPESILSEHGLALLGQFLAG
jgi:anthranilate synthase component II